MKQILLANNKGFAIVDDGDYERINQWKWSLHSSGYAVRTLHIGYFNGKKRTKSILMHREIMNTAEGTETDHEDSNRLNNQRYNIRNATRRQNSRNIGKKCNTSSKFKGVHWCNTIQKWVCRIKVNGKTINLGRYDNEVIAAQRYDEKAKELFGEFARVNF